jgi:hypothetical protein
MIPVRLIAAALTALALAQPALSQNDWVALEARRERETRNWVLGLAALAALGIVLHERGEDDDERRLPGRCLVTWPTPRGEVTLYDPDCLDQRFEAAGRLPLSCAVTVRSEGRFVSGFEPGCLREEGWRAKD